MYLERIYLFILLTACLFLNIDKSALVRAYNNKNLSYKMQNTNLLGIKAIDYKGRVKIIDINEFSPAAKSGIEIGDRILEINGKKISCCDEFINTIANTDTSKIINMVLYRVDSQSTFPITITFQENNEKY